MNIYEYLQEDSCMNNIKAKDKEGVLRLFADRAAADGRFTGISSETIYQKLAEREEQGSTGFGNGIAIPHARVEGAKDFYLGIATSGRGIYFDAVDKKRVHLFICILGPEEQVSEHLQVLAAVSRALAHTGLARELTSAKSDRAIYESFVRHTSPEKEEAEKAEQEEQQLLTVVVYFEDYLHQILEYFIESGIEGATIVDAVGMGQYISNIPLFAEFIGFLRENRNAGKVIMAMVPKSRSQEIIQGIEGITGSFEHREGAMVMLQDVALVRGSMKMF
ncbi:MAG: PTS sugar transporter subunit IIA [Spirochaetales bacterium]|nr:PTS sugar transporter subunit IIA [Spirochaetales bacterium]MCF7939362.1 PTS sugar transporter subunit IIA [Spirochaetales bacterium]